MSFLVIVMIIMVICVLALCPAAAVAVAAVSCNFHCEVVQNELPTNCCNSQLFDGDSDEENKTLVSSHQKHLKEMAAEYETKLKAEKSLQKETMKAKELLQVIGCPVNPDLLKALLLCAVLLYPVLTLCSTCPVPVLSCALLSLSCPFSLLFCPLPVLVLSSPCPCPVSDS
jgi:hypothetical protein